MLLKLFFLNIKGRRVLPEESWRNNTDQERPEGAAGTSCTTGLPRKHRGEYKHRHQSQRQEDAEQRSGGSQGERPIRT